MQRLFAMAALGAALVFGCAGADATTLDPTTDPTYLPEHPDAFIRFDELDTDILDEPQTPDDPPGVLGASQQHFNTCWNGPGYRVSHLEPLNQDNVPTIIGPCYENFPSDTKCIFPNWSRSFNVNWANEIQLSQANCLIGKVGQPAGYQPVGSAEHMQAFDAWKTITGIPFRNVGDGMSHVISVMCSTPATQNLSANADVIGVGVPWGVMTLSTVTPPQLSSSQIAALQPGSFFQIGNPSTKYMYGAGAIWIHDQTQNTFINNQCGGTAAQRLNKAKSLGYANAVHEIGHLLGLSHTNTGVMKIGEACADLGNGSAVVKSTINPAYSAMFDFYETNLTGSGGPPNPCVLAGVLSGTTQETVVGNQNN